MADAEFTDADEPPEEEPEPWRPPVRCPQCDRPETRFVSPRYERLVYECEICGLQFEVDE